MDSGLFPEAPPGALRVLLDGKEVFLSEVEFMMGSSELPSAENFFEADVTELDVSAEKTATSRSADTIHDVNSIFNKKILPHIQMKQWETSMRKFKMFPILVR